ncbi:MAG: hypothetical protein HYW95_01110 [Candidatus Wildermuthbacteria bacterium]|nr:hypothetical protein [Candidatus Wildermuthbacteria bacterium]
MSFFSFFKAKPANILLLDIGDHSIKYLVMRPNQKGERDVLIAAEKQVDEISWEREMHGIIQSVRKEFSYIRSLHFALPPLLFRAEVFEYTVSRKNPKLTIGVKEEKELEEQIIRFSRKEIEYYFSQAYQIPAKDLAIVKLKLLKISVDGYRAASLRGLRGNSVTMRLLGVCLPVGYRMIRENLQKKHGIKEVRIIHWAEGLELFAADSNKEGVYIDIGEKATQVAIIKDNLLQSVKVIPFGGDNFTYALEHHLGLQKTMAQDFKERYSRMEFSEEMRKRTHEVLEREARAWLAACKEKLLLLDQVLPSHLYVMGGTSNLREIEEVAEEDGFRDLPLDGNLQVSLLSPASLMARMQFHQAKDPAYTPVAFLM